MITDDLQGVTILLADDDEEDRAMTISALRERRVANEIRCVSDGEELTDYLFRRGAYADGADAPTPGMILLDLNMPKKDGREVLAEIKADATLRSIPVVVLTTSKAEEDIARTYHLGVNSFITKPVTFLGLVEVMKVFSRYWMEIVDLPGEDGAPE
jgi:CheY-like chemotaxis protein